MATPSHGVRENRKFGGTGSAGQVHSKFAAAARARIASTATALTWPRARVCVVSPTDGHAEERGLRRSVAEPVGVLGLADRDGAIRDKAVVAKPFNRRTAPDRDA